MTGMNYGCKYDWDHNSSHDLFVRTISETYYYIKKTPCKVQASKSSLQYFRASFYSSYPTLLYSTRVTLLYFTLVSLLYST